MLNKLLFMELSSASCANLGNIATPPAHDLHHLVFGMEYSLQLCLPRNKGNKVNPLFWFGQVRKNATDSNRAT
jgi:hypothetical protein